MASFSILSKQVTSLKIAQLPTAKCIHLAKLLNGLTIDRCTAPIIEKLESEIADRDRIAKENASQTVQWMREISEKLRTSKWIDHPNIKRLYEEFENTLFCKPRVKSTSVVKDCPDHYSLVPRLISNNIYPVYPVIGFIGPCLNMLHALSIRLAEFGEKELFSLWAELEEVQGQVRLSRILPGLSLDDIKEMKIPEISARAGYGFTSFNVEDDASKVNNDFVVTYKQCRLIRLILPPFVQSCFSGFQKEAISNWTISRDTDIGTLYQFLKLLSGCHEYKTLSTIEHDAPSKWEDYELLAVKSSLNEFFRPFSSLDSKQHLVSSNTINDSIDLFFNMIEIELLKRDDQTKRGRPNKENAKKFIRKMINNYLASLEKDFDSQNLKSNHDMHLYILETAGHRKEDCISDLSMPLVSNEYREILKSKNIIRKGGAPGKTNSK